MALATYSDLQASVANWLHRADLTSTIPDLIALAEAKLSGDLDARPMESRATLTTTAGNAYVALPTDMLEMRRLIITSSEPIGLLKYATPDQLAQDYPRSTTGQPRVFAVIGANLQLAPAPDAAYTMELAYLQRIPALSGTNTTNWLLTAFPNAYLYATLCAAQPFIANDDRLPLFQALYKEAVDGVNSIDWYSGSTMRVRAA